MACHSEFQVRAMVSPTRARARSTGSTALRCSTPKATAAASGSPNISVRSASAKVRSSSDWADRSAPVTSSADTSVQKSWPCLELSLARQYARLTDTVNAASIVSVCTPGPAVPLTIDSASGGGGPAGTDRQATASGKAKRR